MQPALRRFGNFRFYCPYSGYGGLAVHPRDGRILVACDDVRLMSPEGGLLARHPLKTYARVAFTPDGERFVAGTRGFKEWDEDSNLPVHWFKAVACDLAGKEPSATLFEGSEADISGSQFSADGRRLLLWSEHHGSAWLLSWPGLQLIAQCDVHCGLPFACLSPDACKLLCCCGDRWELFEIGPSGELRSVDRSPPVALPKGATWRDFLNTPRPGATRSGTFLGSGDVFAVGFDDGAVQIVSPSGSEIYRDHTSEVCDLLSCEEGELLLSCDDAGLICARETRTGKLVARYARERERFLSLAISPQGTVLCRGTRETVVLDGPRSLRRVTPEQPMFHLSAGCFTPVDDRIVLTSSDGRVLLLRGADGQPREIYAEQPRKRDSDAEAILLQVEAFFLKDADEIAVRGLGDQYELAILGKDGRLVRHERLPDPMLRNRGGEPQLLRGFAVLPNGDRAVGATWTASFALPKCGRGSGANGMPNFLAVSLPWRFPWKESSWPFPGS